MGGRKSLGDGGGDCAYYLRDCWSPARRLWVGLGLLSSGEGGRGSGGGGGGLGGLALGGGGGAARPHVAVGTVGQTAGELLRGGREGSVTREGSWRCGGTQQRGKRGLVVVCGGVVVIVLDIIKCAIQTYLV